MLDKRICRIHSFGEKAEVLQFILKVAISNVEIFHVLLRQPVCSEMVKLFQLVLGILKMKSIFFKRRLFAPVCDGQIISHYSTPHHEAHNS